MTTNQWIKTACTKLPLPSLRDNTADIDRLIRGIRKELGIKNVNISYPLMKKTPSILREYDYQVNAILFKMDTSWDLIDIFPFQNDFRIFGIAVDLGSTTIVLRLLDLKEGKAIDETSFHNPQIEMGSDILTRIHYAAKKDGLEQLRSVLTDRLNEHILSLTVRNDIKTETIVGMTAAGNTTMTHLFLGLDPQWICREPYIPVVNHLDIMKAKELGIQINPEAPVYILPCVGSYFGGDLIAGILASGIHLQEDLSLLVDVGTNAEVVLGNSEWLMACAGAAGPALEGGVASMGMMAAPGVIDKVSIDPESNELQIRTIHNKSPIGICGSGLIDLIAQLFLAGLIDLRGKFVPKRCGKRLKTMDGIHHLVVVTSKNSSTGCDLTLSQTDINALMRSKAAMYTILTTLTKMINISFDEVKNFYMAGTFGSFIDPNSAITLGMIPDVPLKRYQSLGNTSLQGASLALLSDEAKNEAEKIRDRITYIELNVNQEFMNNFSAAKFIPHTDKTLFPSVKEWDEDRGIIL